MYAGDNKDFLPPTGTLMNDVTSDWQLRTPLGTNFNAGMVIANAGTTISTGNIASYKSFACPDASYFTLKKLDDDWSNPSGVPESSYLYRSKMHGRLEKLGDLNGQEPNNLIMTDFNKYYGSPNENHRGKLVNVLFADGHVATANNISNELGIYVPARLSNYWNILKVKFPGGI
jgi:prepilin-type processing-associated H-X9-DG protein